MVPRDSLSESIDSFCHGNYKHICSSFTGYKHSCDYQFEVTSGEYVMYVIIDDLRCNNETLWTNKSALCVYSGTCTVKVSYTITYRMISENNIKRKCTSKNEICLITISSREILKNQPDFISLFL